MAVPSAWTICRIAALFSKRRVSPRPSVHALVKEKALMQRSRVSRARDPFR
jgi:hypothetical protein